MEAVQQRPPTSFSKRFRWAGCWLGFGLGGFFDGILLHQILQWHHLLLAVERPAFRDIRVQILADGLFHALMYVIALAGLWLLWRARREFAEPGADRLLLGNALIGFGIWHVLDTFLSHWILGIHRIRMDVDNPLVWDLLWFAVFGIAPIAAGWLMRRGSGGGGASGNRRRTGAPAALTLAVLIAGPAAALPPPDASTIMVLFRPGATPQSVLAAVEAVDGRIVWNDPSGQVWAIDLGAEGDAAKLYRHGALLVSNTLLPASCIDWFRI